MSRKEVIGKSRFQFNLVAYYFNYFKTRSVILDIRENF